MPRGTAHTLTLRANKRRLRTASPSFFAGHMLFVQAFDELGATATEGAPDYWSRRAGSTTVVRVPGQHVGEHSFLSRENASATADAIVRELEAIRGSHGG